MASLLMKTKTKPDRASYFRKLDKDKEERYAGQD